jgi:hypothetical protein
VNRELLVLNHVYFYNPTAGVFKPVQFIGNIPGGIGTRKLVFRDLHQNEIVIRRPKNIYAHSAICPTFFNDAASCSCELEKDNLAEKFKRIEA